MRIRRTAAAATAAAMTAGGLVLAGAGTASADTVDYKPDRVISGSRAQVEGAMALEIAPDGTTYFARMMVDSVRVFGPSADGNATPVRVKKLGVPGFEGGVDLETDGAGRVYARTATEDTTTIRVYSPRFASKLRTITFNKVVGGFAVSPQGGIAVLAGAGDNIEVYAPGATGAATPVRVISGPETGLDAGFTDLAYDGAGRIWAAGSLEEFLGFAPGASGDVAPSARVSGDRTGVVWPRWIDVDRANRVYVTDFGAKSITVFPPSVNGDAAPLRVLRGPKANIRGHHVAVSARGDIVTTVSPRAMGVFRTLFPVRPTAVRSVRVTGKVSAAKRTVRWKKPAYDGGRDVRSYKLVFRKGSKTLKTVTLKPGRRSYKVAKSALRRGKLTVTVRAKTAKGWSPKVAKTFRVR